MSRTPPTAVYAVPKIDRRRQPRDRDRITDLEQAIQAVEQARANLRWHLRVLRTMVQGAERDGMQTGTEKTNEA